MMKMKTRRPKLLFTVAVLFIVGGFFASSAHAQITAPHAIGGLPGFQAYWKPSEVAVPGTATLFWFFDRSIQIGSFGITSLHISCDGQIYSQVDVGLTSGSIPFYLTKPEPENCTFSSTDVRTGTVYILGAYTVYAGLPGTSYGNPPSSQSDSVSCNISLTPEIAPTAPIMSNNQIIPLYDYRFSFSPHLAQSATYSCTGPIPRSGPIEAYSGIWSFGPDQAGMTEACTAIVYGLGGYGRNTCSTSAVISPSYSLIPASCTIGVGASSCVVNVTWASPDLSRMGALAPLLTVQQPYIAPGHVFATGQNGTKATTLTPPGTYPFDLVLVETFYVPFVYSARVTSANFTASCAAGTTWNGGVCAAVPPANCAATAIGACSLPVTPSGGSAGSCVSGYVGACRYACTNGAWSRDSNSCALPTPATVFISASPARVRSGSSSTISWSATSVQSCHVKDSVGNNLANGNADRGNNFQTSSPYTAAINSQTTYTITCQPKDGSAPVSKSATVNVIPVFQEF